MSFGIFENLDSGNDSLTVTATASRRNFAAQVHQANKDFGQFLASAESVADLEDRVRLVEAELREAGVNDPQSVLDGLAALAASDDTDDDSDSSDDDSDVPDFVDTDKDDDKDRDDDSKKESKVALNEPLPNDPNNTTNAAPVAAAPSMSPTNPTPAGIPGQAGGHPVVPRNVSTPPLAGGAPSIPGVGSPVGVPGVPQQNVIPQQRTYSKVLPVVPRIKK